MAKKKQEEIKEEKVSEKETLKKEKKGFPNHLVITKSDDPRAKWFVVHTYSGHEARVMASLQQRVETMKLADRILEVLIPTQEQIQIRSGKKHQVTEKIFPGYILVRMILDDNSWLAVRTTQGVTGFVGVGNKPTPISDEEVNTIQKFMSMEAPKYRAKFSAGEAVKIIDGPFNEFLGSIESIDEERGKLKVLVSIFGRETPVELDFLQVKKL
jgi:transcriptional antiterminator NusG